MYGEKMGTVPLKNSAGNDDKEDLLFSKRSITDNVFRNVSMLC